MRSNVAKNVVTSYSATDPSLRIPFITEISHKTFHAVSSKGFEFLSALEGSTFLAISGRMACRTRSTFSTLSRYFSLFRNDTISRWTDETDVWYITLIVIMSTVFYLSLLVKAVQRLFKEQTRNGEGIILLL